MCRKKIRYDATCRHCYGGRVYEAFGQVASITCCSLNNEPLYMANHLDDTTNVGLCTGAPVVVLVNPIDSLVDSVETSCYVCGSDTGEIHTCLLCGCLPYEQNSTMEAEGVGSQLVVVDVVVVFSSY